MKALVTGAEGFIGSHLVEHLLSVGDSVVCSYHDGSTLWRLAPVREHVTLEEVDVRDAAAVDKLVGFHEPDAIYHLAAQSLPTLSLVEPALTLETNSVGTVNVFESVRHIVPKARVLLACSSAEYGMVSEEEVPTHESHRLLPMHPYGVSKVAQDLLAYQYHRNFGTRAIRARIYNTTGPRKTGDVLADLTWRVSQIELGRSEPTLHVGNLEPRRDITDVRDNVRALRMLIERAEAGEVYNVCSGEVRSVRELVDLVLEEARVELDVQQDPRLLRPSDEPVIAGDNTRLVEATGWTPEIRIERTVADMMAFWREHPDL